jgi:hypothetical protein
MPRHPIEFVSFSVAIFSSLKKSSGISRKSERACKMHPVAANDRFHLQARESFAPIFLCVRKSFGTRSCSNQKFPLQRGIAIAWVSKVKDPQWQVS